MKSNVVHQPHLAPPDMKARCQEVFRLVSEGDPDLREVARRAREIPALAELLMRQVNSAGIGLRNRVTEVDHAVSLLGTLRVRRMVEQLLRDTTRLRELSQATAFHVPATSAGGETPTA